MFALLAYAPTLAFPCSPTLNSQEQGQGAVIKEKCSGQSWMTKAETLSQCQVWAVNQR